MSDEGQPVRKIADLGFWREARAQGKPRPEYEDDGSGDGFDGGGPGGPSGPVDGDGEPGPIWCSDDSLAVLLINELHPDWRYVKAWDQWLFWDGRCWVEDDKLGVFTRARQVCRRVANGAEGSKGFQRAIDSAKTIAAAERLARSDRRVATSAERTWDQDPFLLNTQGGIIDLRTGVLGPSDRDKLMMQLAGATPEGDCPHWRKFVNEVTGGDAAYRDYLQRLVGYSLTGSTKEEIFAFLHGPSNTGKSKFVAHPRTIARHLCLQCANGHLYRDQSRAPSDRPRRLYGQEAGHRRRDRGGAALGSAAADDIDWRRPSHGAVYAR